MNKNAPLTLVKTLNPNAVSEQRIDLLAGLQEFNDSAELSALVLHKERQVALGQQSSENSGTSFKGCQRTCTFRLRSTSYSYMHPRKCMKELSLCTSSGVLMI
jgi:hypothetical protein